MEDKWSKRLKYEECRKFVKVHIVCFDFLLVCFWIKGIQRVVRKKINKWKRVKDRVLVKAITMCSIKCKKSLNEVIKVILIIKKRKIMDNKQELSLILYSILI